MGALTGQVAVVTGATSGIGRAVALGLATQGAALCLIGRRGEILEALAQDARQTATRVLHRRVDLTVDQDIAELEKYLQRNFDGIDILVHGAGVIALGKVEHAPVEDFDLQYRTNVRAPYLLTQALLPMLRRGQGQIVFINSSVGLSAKANVSQYSATKHALKALADSLRDEVNPRGMRVLSVFLGRTASPMQASVTQMEGRVYQPQLLLQPDEVAAVVINALTLPWTAEVTDISLRPMQKLESAP